MIKNQIIELINKGRQLLKNRRGNSLIQGIIVSAIVLIALVALNPNISGFINSIWNSFEAFIDGKLNGLFNS